MPVEAEGPRVRLRAPAGEEEASQRETHQGDQRDDLAVVLVVARLGDLLELPVDDGLLDLTVIRAISKMKVIKHVSKLYDGSFIKLKFVELYRGKECRIISRPAGAAFLEADGESLGHSPLEFSVIPGSLSLIIPDETGKNKQ